MCERCEATVEETLCIEDKCHRKVDPIFDGNLSSSRDPWSSYQGMWANAVKTSLAPNTEAQKHRLIGGSPNVDYEGDMSIVDFCGLKSCQESYAVIKS
jgi:hypothetical protein